MERSNRNDSAITSLRYRCVRNDKCLAGHDITPLNPPFLKGEKEIQFPTLESYGVHTSLLTCTFVAFTCTFVALTCTFVALTCTFIALTCTFVALTCIFVALTCTFIALTCTFVALTCTFVALTCKN